MRRNLSSSCSPGPASGRNRYRKRFYFKVDKQIIKPPNDLTIREKNLAHVLIFTAEFNFNFFLRHAAS